tara:strand:- start:1926 stop:2345 length:420 start_codon:yes stop_codon:yes gene_type:complete
MRSLNETIKLGSNYWKNPLINNAYFDEFRTTRHFEDRFHECRKIRNKYPDRIPVICQKSRTSTLTQLQKTKYLVPQDLTSTQFLFIIRKRLTLPSEKGVFLFVNNILASSNQTILELYENYKDPDGFLYMFYSDENVFG